MTTIAYDRDGGIFILNVAPGNETPIEAIVAEQGITSYVVITEEDFPSAFQYMGAWKILDEKLSVDILKAKDLARRIYTNKKTYKLNNLFTEFQKQAFLGNTQTSELSDRARQISEINIDDLVNNIKTIEDLNAFNIPELE